MTKPGTAGERIQHFFDNVHAGGSGLLVLRNQEELYSEVVPYLASKKIPFCAQRHSAKMDGKELRFRVYRTMNDVYKVAGMEFSWIWSVGVPEGMVGYLLTRLRNRHGDENWHNMVVWP